MQFECPDYKTWKDSCKHLFAAMLFIKNTGKQTTEGLNGFNGNVAHAVQSDLAPERQTESKENVSKLAQCNVPHLEPKPFDRHRMVTRLAVLNTATDIAKTWGETC